MKYLIAIYFLLLSSTQLFAQNPPLLKPEFQMKTWMTRPANPKFKRGDDYFGYDTKATDSLDPQFGETETPNSPGFPDYYFDLTPTITGPVDIRHKPDSAKFTLEFPVHATTGDNTLYPIVLHWDRSQIPSQLRSIHLVAAQGRNVLADLLASDSVVVPADPFGDYMNAIIILTYDQSAAVTPRGPSQEGELYSLSIYPNPVSTSATLTFGLQSSSKVSVDVCDELGRVISHETYDGHPGDNRITLERNNMGATQGIRHVIVTAVSHNGVLRSTYPLLVR